MGRGWLQACCSCAEKAFYRKRTNHTEAVPFAAGPGLSSELESLTILAAHDCARLQGGLQTSPITAGALGFLGRINLSSVNLGGAKGGGDSIINQSGNNSTANIGNTGIALVSVGAVYF